MKKIRLAALLILCVLLFAACGEKTPDYTCETVADALKKAVPFPEMTQMTDKYIAKHLYLEGDEWTEAVMWCGQIGVQADTILLIKAADDKKVQTVYEAAQEYLNEMKEGYRDYQPGEMPKLEKAVLTKKNNTVLLLICEDQTKAAPVLKQYALN